MTNDLNDERFERLECLTFKYFKTNKYLKNE